ncbi:MAG: HEAT repeat domain-containing protein, partial [bacterium]|nr:HEAT repeat domain-containing protein [bacterium]
MSEGELLDIVQVKYILQQGSQVQRKIAVNWLKKQDTRETVDMLIQTFTDVYWLVRRMAADAVAELGEKYSDQVISALDDENLDINYWSIQVLAKWGGDYHRPILKALDHPSDEVKSDAVKALRGFPHEDIMLRLIDLLDYENWHLRRLSADSLEHMGEPAIPFLKNAFKKHLTDKHGEDISYWTCRILSKLLEKESLSFLKKLLSSQFDNLRYHAIGALGDIEGSKSLPALIKSFNDRSWVVRAKASAVIEAKGAAVIPYLKKAFLKGNSDIKYWTIKLIAKILKSKAIPVIDDLIHQVPGEVDFYAVSALGEINSEAAIDPLIECFQSSSWLIRQTAAEMLKKMGNRPMDKLIKALDSEYEDVQFFAIQVLSHIGGRAIPILKKRLREGSTKTKLAVINAFGKQESKGVEQALIDALSDSEWVVRNQSAIALEELGPDVVEELIQVFDEWHEDKNFWSVQIMKSLFPAVLKNLEDYLCSDDEYRVWQTTCGYIMLAKELGDQDRKLLFESFSRTTGGDKASLLV